MEKRNDGYCDYCGRFDNFETHNFTKKTKVYNIDKYPEIKVPHEFEVKFEQEKGLDSGDVRFGERFLQDELRIRYL